MAADTDKNVKMATRDRCLSSIKDKAKVDKSVNGQYSNLNLNKNHQCFTENFVQSKNHFNKSHQSYDFKNDSNGKNEFSSLWNKTTKSDDAFHIAIHDSDKKKKLQDQTKNSKSTVNNSTLSLHIAAYENSIIDSEISDGSTFDIGKSNCSKKLTNKTSFLTSSIIQNSFEFPRQQENGGGEPEVAQFKAAQKLLNLKNGNGAVMLWSFPHHISQTRFGERKKPSNACCLIAAALAEIIFRNGIYLPVWDGNNCVNIDALYYTTKQRSSGKPIQTKQNLLPSRLCDAMVNAIINGNNRADKSFEDGRVCELFNVPTALQLLGSSFGEVSYVTTKSLHGDSSSLLYGNLKSAIDHPSLCDWKQLFFLTMFVERCVLIVYERDTETIAIFDSHTHKQFGALIAVSNHGNLHHFCIYTIKRFFPETLVIKPEAMRFEMSMLFFQGILTDLDSPIDSKCLKRAPNLQEKKKRPNIFENYEKSLKEIHWKNTHRLHIKKKGGVLDFWKRI